MKPYKFATFNCQGLLNPVKKLNIADDFIHLKLTAMMIQETHIKKTGMYILKTSSGEILHLYNSGNENKSAAGVAILIKPTNNQITFRPISDRICAIKTKTGNVTTHLISAYAPTMETTKRQPEETRSFYNTLTSVISKTKRRDCIIIGGDFNAKTRIADRNNLERIVGKYAKNEININGEKLIEFCYINDLRITNTSSSTKISQNQ